MALALAQADPAAARRSAARSSTRAVFHVRVARPEEREPRFLTWDEAEELRSWIPEHVSRVVPIGILTMLRRGEILGLRDVDIDFEPGSIAVFSNARPAHA